MANESAIRVRAKAFRVRIAFLIYAHAKMDGKSETGQKKEVMSLHVETDKKPCHSVFDNAIWSFKGLLREAPLAFVAMALQMPLHIFLAYGAVYLPALVVGEVTGGESLAHGARRMGILLLMMLAADILLLFLHAVSDTSQTIYRKQKTVELNRKSMDCFYQIYEKKENRDLHDRAIWATTQWNGALPVCDLPKRSLKLVESIGCYCLFGSVISFVSPALVPILTIAPLVNWFCARLYRRWEYANRGKWADIDRRLEYVQRMPGDFQAAKDIRVYGLADWFKETFKGLARQRLAWEKRQTGREFLSRIADLAVILFRDGAAYALLIHMTLSGEITVDGFVLYFSAISMFASFVGNIVEEWNGMHTSSLSICDYRQYLDLPEWNGTGEADVDRHLRGAPEITFEHVSFCYEGAEEETLRDIHFTVKPGEKIALVGLNGAGKTTLVKILCGLYRPTGGEIRINGVPARHFARKDYYRLFSPVFQEVKTAFFTLAETVAGDFGGKVDLEKARECMRLAGLGEKIDQLPRGIHTKLDKQVNQDGTELSGGQLQKLMLARALYKNAPILVLDEPTAALDPIAENQIYLQYNRMSKDKTSLFISHRLASTQFCDRILYMKEGRIAEEGTHEQLLQLGGEYSRLYQMQSCWYREDYEGDESDAGKRKVGK